MIIFIGLLAFAALPVVLAFIFLELNAEKQGQHANDWPRKLAKLAGWGIFALVVVTFVVMMPNSEEPYRLDGFFKVIFKFLNFLK